MPIAADPSETYRELSRQLREVAVLNSIGGVLSWDEQTYMPASAAGHRADQSAVISRLAHERLTAPAVGEMLDALAAAPASFDPDSEMAVNVREARRIYDRARKLPTSLVEELTRTEVLAQQAWSEAKKRSHFPTFRPWLEKILKLKRQECDCVGFAAEPYDALLDQYEPGETAAGVRSVFNSLREPLVDLVARINESGRQAPLAIVHRHYPAAAQERFARQAARAVGFDFNAGRLDISVHPFCTHLGPGDVRMTTRYDEHDFVNAFFGVLHETGHGLYSQGLPDVQFGLPLGQDVSLGIHESQSRLWENLVGRSKSFWKHFFPQAQQAFPAALADVSLDDWHFALNDVRPSFVRTEADETTYNLHVLLRFELERALLHGDLSVADLPGAWNEQMQANLGIEPPDDTHGCLQDIHWSGGALGYFPTYTLGNLYASQFLEQARVDLGDLDAKFERGEFAPLLQWLRHNIHRHGMRYHPQELCRRITEKPLSPDALLRHLRGKAAELYRV